MSAACCGPNSRAAQRPQVLVRAARAASRRVPRVVEEELDRHLHRLEVAHVHDPQPVGPVAATRGASAPRSWAIGVRVDPLVRPRAAHVVEVVVDARAAGALALLGRRQAPDVAPVVVAPEQRHVVGHAHALARSTPALPCRAPTPADAARLRPAPRARISRWSATMRSSSATFGLARHRLVAVAAHAERHDVLVVARLRRMPSRQNARSASRVLARSSRALLP